MQHRYPPNPTVEVNLNAIAHNYAVLRGQAAGKATGCAAVVKANAYGLGVEQIAPALYEAGCRHYFVATLDEGIELKKLFSLPTFADAAIYTFHGVRKGQAKDFLAHGIIPVLNDPAQVEHWGNSGKYVLHVDTGMCRLGLTLNELEKLPSIPNQLQLVISHLACADDPQNPKNKEQLMLFRNALQRFPGIPASLANSSGVFLGADYHFSILRPGCSLYGISPNTALPNPMKNVVQLSAPVLQYRPIDRDQSVGYGASATATKGSVLATVEIGYADGFSRILSNNMFGFAGGIRIPLVGRVSMDMVTMDVSDVPDHLRNENLRITFIGKEQTVDVVAKMAGTIGYEIFTSLGTRIKRIYVKE